MIDHREGLPIRFRDALAPFVATVVVNERCNESCGHCWFTVPWAPDPPLREIAARVWALRSRGARFIAFTGGEPSLREDLEELVAYARGLRMRVGLLTNGTRIDDARAERLVAAGVSAVSLTLFSAAPAAHEAITRLTGSFTATTRAARAFQRSGIPTTIRTPVMKPNKDCVGGLATLCAHERWIFEPYTHLDPPRGLSVAAWALDPAEAAVVEGLHQGVFAPTFDRFGFAEAVVDARGIHHDGQCPTNPIGEIEPLPPAAALDAPASSI